MRSSETAAFFGHAGDCYSEIALTHLRTLFSTVTEFMGTTAVPPSVPDPGELDVDWLFCFKSKTIFRQRTLNSIRKAAINFHTSLPCYPGSGGVNWALYNGDQTSGITVHRLTPSVDAGPILELFPFPCNHADTVETLLELTYRHHLFAFLRVTETIARSGLEWVLRSEHEYSGQNWGPRTYRLRDLEELKRIDPAMATDEVERRIRATRYRHFGPFVELGLHRFYLSDS